MNRLLVAISLSLLCLSPAWADRVRVDDTETSFETEVQVELEPGKKVKKVAARLTGVGLRKHRLGFHAYAIASYLDTSASVTTAKQLIESDSVKLLHMVMQRDVDGDNVSEALTTAVGRNHDDAEEKFKQEFKAFVKYFGTDELTEGTSVRFTHVPKVGLKCSLGKKKPITIKSVKFARAIWEIFLGKNPAQSDLKTGLLKRLKK